MNKIVMNYYEDNDINIKIFYDSKSERLKISGVNEDNIDSVVQKFIDRCNILIEQEIINILKDSSRIEKILDAMSREDLTSMLLQYKLLVEKRLFDRT